MDGVHRCLTLLMLQCKIAEIFTNYSCGHIFITINFPKREINNSTTILTNIYWPVIRSFGSQ